MEPSNAGKIKLRAYFDEEAKLHIVDQDDREFEFVPEYRTAHGNDKVVQIQIELEAPYWPDLKPHVNVTFRVPLEVKTKKMQEMIDSMTRE